MLIVKFAETHTNQETGRKYIINEPVVPNGNSKKQSYKNFVSNQLLQENS